CGSADARLRGRAAIMRKPSSLTSWIQPGPDGGRSADESGHAGHVEKDGSMSRGSGRQLSHSMSHLKVGISAGNGGLLATPWGGRSRWRGGRGCPRAPCFLPGGGGFSFLAGGTGSPRSDLLWRGRPSFLIPPHILPHGTSQPFLPPPVKRGFFLRSS